MVYTALGIIHPDSTPIDYQLLPYINIVDAMPKGHIQYFYISEVIAKAHFPSCTQRDDQQDNVDQEYQSMIEQALPS